MTADVPSGGQARERILRDIETNPGIYRAHLVRSTALGWGTVNHHVCWLVAHGFVNREVVGARHYLFAASLPPREALPPRARRLLSALRGGPAGTAQLARHTGMGTSVVRRYVRLLTERGLVEEQPGYHSRFILRSAPHAAASAPDATG